MSWAGFDGAKASCRQNLEFSTDYTGSTVSLGDLEVAFDHLQGMVKAGGEEEGAPLSAPLAIGENRHLRAGRRDE
jgi:hypothetical protein